jgi:hypothetical protein
MPRVQLSQLSPYGSGLKYGAMAVALGVPSKTSNKAQVLREFSTSWIKSYAEEGKWQVVYDVWGAREQVELPAAVMQLRSCTANIGAVSAC